ncbi:MFS transporter [Nocardioides sp. LMS-CY]|uniref:MFS transporter n=1 Tax=Nocardioides sp. (strain LMS-CY) TaxID=2840457 RepID=UPI001C0087A4|nr:MFS transporter [Nocardioides sp. LMS-CY]QWF21430.1 MFS transporter [Nocardioides sp. LMS-CY]
MYITLSDRPQAPVGTPRGRRRRVAPVVVTLGIVSLVTDISSESVAAILPLYLTGVLGLSTISYGFVDALYQGVSALVRIGGGWAADRGGHPKWVAFLGYGLSAVARFFLLFSAGLATVSAVISADRVGKGLRTAPRDAMISAATPPSQLGAAFGVHRTLDTIGAAVGPLLAFAILWWIPDGYVTVMVVSLGFAVLGVALLGLLVPDRPAAQPRPARTPVRWREVAQPGLVRLLVVAGALGLLTVGDGFIYLALLDRGGFAAHWFPLLYVGTNIAYLSLAIPIGRLADRVGKARVLVCGHAALLASYVVAAVSWDATASTLLALLLLGTFYAATDGVTAALAGRLVPTTVRASGIASAQTVVAVARMASSAIFGVLWFVLGPQLALVVVGTGLLVALPLALGAVRRLDLEAGAAR